MGKLEGKIAVVTGGSSGIGLATAEAFVVEGAHVFVTGRRLAELDAAVAHLGNNVTPVQGDVSKPDDLDRLYRQVKHEKGKIDVLFANAGIGDTARLGELTDKHIDDLLSINIKGVILTVQKALPLLAPGASVILNASIAASKGFAEWSVYSATKAAVRSFARTWSADLKGRDIRINAVSPGVIDTPGLTGVIGPDETQLAAYFAQTANIAPIGRNGVPSDVAKLVSFLACDDSRFMTGSEIFVDGGIAQI
jgi:NAD(P)-dependent dehydrogenase (short-subunit alcohol dehydrogenase family)